MSGDRTWYSVTAYWPSPAGFQEVDTLLSGLGFQRNQPDPASWHGGEHPADQGRRSRRSCGAWPPGTGSRSRWRRRPPTSAWAASIPIYPTLPDQDVLHQTTVGNDRDDYLPVQQVWDAIDQTTTREELIQALEAESGRLVERGLAAWRDPRDPPATP